MSEQTYWRGPFLAYTSPSVAPEMMLEWSLTLILDFGSDFDTAHAAILNPVNIFEYCENIYVFLF
jgi:hypothetical protein